MGNLSWLSSLSCSAWRMPSTSAGLESSGGACLVICRHEVSHATQPSKGKMILKMLDAIIYTEIQSVDYLEHSSVV